MKLKRQEISKIDDQKTVSSSSPFVLHFGTKVPSFFYTVFLRQPNNFYLGFMVRVRQRTTTSQFYQ